MKQTLLFLTILIITNSLPAQNRSIARGAEPGELYLSYFWYGVYAPPGPPFYDTLRNAVFRFTENGKKLTIQYDGDYFIDLDSVMFPNIILADVTSGVLYNKQVVHKSDGYPYTQLWVSLDYGKNWIFREENIGSKNYFSANFDGLIYRAGTDGTFKSTNYAETFSLIHVQQFAAHETGLKECEFFSLIGRGFYHTLDCYQNYINITIDEEYVFGQISGIFPDVYRGGKAGEVYVSSMFPDPGYKVTYKVSFSSDTGHTFRHVFVSESFDMVYTHPPLFISDREPGVFYIIRSYEVEDTNPLGWHTKLCVEHYKDYGETLVNIYCHDITKYYGSTCEAINDLVLEKCNPNCILLSWSEPESSLPVESYQVYRNNMLITNYELRENTYLDENLPLGEYEYYVVTHYTTGCVSDSSNHVTERVELGVKGVKELEGVSLFPNPTTGELRVTSYKLRMLKFLISMAKNYHCIISSPHHLIISSTSLIYKQEYIL
jgi:hypothetical protein